MRCGRLAAALDPEFGASNGGDARPQRTDAAAADRHRVVLGRLHLKEHLTPQRSNGLLAMVERIRKDAREAIEKAPTVH